MAKYRINLEIEIEFNSLKECEDWMWSVHGHVDKLFKDEKIQSVIVNGVTDITNYASYSRAGHNPLGGIIVR